MELPSARPYAYRFKAESTALIIIDMQRDFVDLNGFGQIQCGNDEIFQKVRDIVPRCQRALETARQLGMYVVHTREGHKPDLSDLPPSKRLRQISAPSGHHIMGIGDAGPMGRLLVRGEYGHDIIDELKPLPGEFVVDKPGKGSFWDTPLHRGLLARGITHLLFAGVTTECCVNTTARECADRGFETCILSDCTDGFYEPFYTSTLDMLCSYDGLFGFVGSSSEFVKYASVSVSTPPATPPPSLPFSGAISRDISLGALRKQYSSGETKPTDVIKEVIARINDYMTNDPAVWTHVRDSDALLAAAASIERTYAGKALPPLYGVPFAVKCNIDVAGIPTTAACEAYTYTPTESSKLFNKLVAAGAIFVGKTNLDQLATGLSGCRSPFGAPRSVYSRAHISGGSSSGSAVAVGANLVSFALATDTAGSGRVPAAFNGIIGFKPTKGTFSAKGLVPACRSLDTITIMTRTAEEARNVWLTADEGPDMTDAYAKPQQSLALWQADFRGVKVGGFKFGVPSAAALEHCDETYKNLFGEAAQKLQRAGGVPHEIDWTPFENGTNLLYEASLVQERVACLGPQFLMENMKTFEPAIQQIFAAALNTTVKPWDVFRDQHLQVEYTRQAHEVLRSIDVLLVPTTTCHPKVEEIEAEPLALNSRLGYFTHFGNVLDLCGIAVPASTYQSEGETLPFGVTLLGAPGTDGKIFDIAREFERTL